ncbi:hypothetical protein [Actinacidiphila paucisporea]|uniref:Uncharacterized protein n=1 Tax=Actinacidiphila paucisporea TaxID=310782 RepID=A0A1M7AD18_9ACTN|nr:hypothetical protein [Actinacidiphila paucisporea]SHL40594.1 hypothetical protein SAMN05216499_10460 [Actinacidiphila paucisporea]
MSELMRPQDTAGVPAGHERISGPANVRNEAEFFDARARADEEAVEEARVHHEGLAARVVASGESVHELLERLRRRTIPNRAELRLLADAFAKHNEATEVTARRALERHPGAVEAVQEDRAEGERLLQMLSYLIAGELPETTYGLTVSGTLAAIDQYVGHERRDLVPAIDRELSPIENARLARSFPA